MSEDTPTRQGAASGDLADLLGRGGLPAELRHASGMKKLSYITSLPAPAAFVEQLASEELYLLLRDIGKRDAYPLLAYATADQLQAIVDLDAWHKHELQLPRWLEWLDLSLAADIDTGLRFLAASDDELLEWLFVGQGGVRILGNDVELSDIPDELAAFDTPDGMYRVTLPRDHALADRMPQLLKLLWAMDVDRMRVIFQQARFDLASSVEEYMERFRGGRLQDLGFEAPSEAARVFSSGDPAGLRARVRAGLDQLAPLSRICSDATAGGLVLRGVTPPRLLGAALARLDDEPRARFAEAMTALVNRVFMALTGDLSRTEDLPTAGRHAAALVNLGLQHVADGDVATAARALERIWPVELFQAGHALTLDVARAARQIARRSGANAGLSPFGSPTDEALHGVALPRPLLFEGVIDRARVSYRPFADLRELARVAALVEDADAVLGLFETQLGHSPEALDSLNIDDDARRRLSLATLLRTALAQLIVRDAFSFAPLSAGDVAAFARAAFTPQGALSEPLKAALSRITGTAPEAVGAFAERAVAELVEAIGGVRPEAIDPRYAGDLFLIAPG
ncbi:MAG: hypothetical protein CSA66_04635 [Proteobacteria bacterium]|nr:MAG: hypothetical protein CSA66_04635 [Pseudomonadota bacterium]